MQHGHRLQFLLKLINALSASCLDAVTTVRSATNNVIGIDVYCVHRSKLLFQSRHCFVPRASDLDLQLRFRVITCRN